MHINAVALKMSCLCLSNPKIKPVTCECLQCIQSVWCDILSRHRLGRCVKIRPSQQTAAVHSSKARSHHRPQSKQEQSKFNTLYKLSLHRWPQSMLLRPTLFFCEQCINSNLYLAWVHQPFPAADAAKRNLWAFHFASGKVPQAAKLYGTWRQAFRSIRAPENKQKTGYTHAHTPHDTKSTVGDCFEQQWVRLEQTTSTKTTWPTFPNQSRQQTGRNHSLHTLT